MPTGIYQHKPLSEEHKRKIGLAHIGLKYKHWTEIGRQNARNAQKGTKKPWVGIVNRERCKGSGNGMWKGNNVGYRALHHWVYKWLGKPCQCEKCGKLRVSPKSIHWANKSGKYLRDLTDWIQLCVPCHKEYDKTLKVNLI